jgi:alpha-beta hydrolase superfamily lysophospholipase
MNTVDSKCFERSLTTSDGLSLNLGVCFHDAKEWIVVTHGIGEHFNRHLYMKHLFTPDFNILFYDLRGHGKSGGKRAYVQHFDRYIQDLREVIECLKKELFPSLGGDKFYLMGHSMGALITMAYLQTQPGPMYYPEKVFVNAPPLGIPGFLGSLVRFLPMSLLAKIPFSLPLKGLVDLKWLSPNPEVATEYIKDPLNCLKLHTKTVFAMLNKGREIASRPLEARCPVLITVGSLDKIVDPVAIQAYAASLGPDIHLEVIHGAYHEIHNCPDDIRTTYFTFLSDFFRK